ncbi:hypothetical protein M8J77_020338 [Diaphorina citri]|nr:hypothetical protein M8J77_020338 [Diaphorina citri]
MVHLMRLKDSFILGATPEIELFVCARVRIGEIYPHISNPLLGITKILYTLKKILTRHKEYCSLENENTNIVNFWNRASAIVTLPFQVQHSCDPALNFNWKNFEDF